MTDLSGSANTEADRQFAENLWADWESTTLDWLRESTTHVDVRDDAATKIDFEALTGAERVVFFHPNGRLVVGAAAAPALPLSPLMVEVSVPVDDAYTSGAIELTRRMLEAAVAARVQALVQFGPLDDVVTATGVLRVKVWESPSSWHVVVGTKMAAGIPVPVDAAGVVEDEQPVVPEPVVEPEPVADLLVEPATPLDGAVIGTVEVPTPADGDGGAGSDAKKAPAKKAAGKKP